MITAVGTIGDEEKFMFINRVFGKCQPCKDKNLMKCIVIYSMIVFLSVSAFAASELAFDSSGAPTSLVLGDVLFLDSSDGGIFVTDGGTTSAPQSVVTNGNTVVVTANGGSAVFTLQIDSYDNHVAIHLMDAQGVGTGADYSLSIEIHSSNYEDIAAYTLNDIMTENTDNTRRNFLELTWPYIWSRPRADGSRGSVVLYNNTLQGSSLDAVLAEIWSTQAEAGHMVKPAVDSWTEADVLDWVGRWVEKFSLIAAVSVHPEEDEDELYEMINEYVIPLGATRVYMFQTSWYDEPYTTPRSNIFPNGNPDMLAFSEYLASRGIQLQLKSMGPQVLSDDECYISSTFVDDRLMAWSTGTLEEAISSTSTTIQFRGAVGLGFDLWEKSYFRLDNEIIHAESITNTDNDVWVLEGCKRGQEGTTAGSHSSGIEMVGLVTRYGNFNYPDDFDLSNSLGEEIVGEYADFMNEMKTSHLHFDGTGLITPPWYIREYTDYAYSRMGELSTGSTVGRGGLAAHFEMKFSGAQEISGMLNYWMLRIGPRLHETGRRHIETATSKLELHFDISDGIMRESRRVLLCGGISTRKLWKGLLDAYGLTDHCLDLFGYWKELAPVFTDADAAYVSGFLKKRSTHYTGPDVLVLSINDSNEYIFTPHRVMGRTSGKDENFIIDQEWGAKARWQEITAGTTMELENPYKTQELQAMIWVQENSSALQDPLITVNGSGTLSVDGTIQPMEYMHFEGGNSVTVYDKDWTLLRTLPATATNFTANNGTLTVTTAAGSGSNTPSLKVQYVTLGPVYVLEANDFITHRPVRENVDLTATYQVLETNIIWQSAVPISSASDVSFEGTLVEAINCGTSSSSPAVNGVTFRGSTSVLAESHAASDIYSGSGGPYETLLDSFAYNGTTAAFTIGSLEAGSNYQIQLWYVDQRSGKENRRMTYEDKNGNVSDLINGHYVIGEFTANSTTVEITITASVVSGTNTNDAHLNAYQIRKLSVE